MDVNHRIQFYIKESSDWSKIDHRMKFLDSPLNADLDYLCFHLTRELFLISDQKISWFFELFIKMAF